MPEYSWDLPSPAAPPAPSTGGPANATARTVLLGGLLDQLIDPITRDFVDTEDGAWAETADSRSIVWIMLDTWLGHSYSAPGDGTRIGEQLERGDPVTPEFVVAEVTRAMRILEQAGVLTGFTMRAFDDRGQPLVVDGRFTPELRYTDLASGSPIDLAYRSPLQG